MKVWPDPKNIFKKPLTKAEKAKEKRQQAKAEMLSEILRIREVQFRHQEENRKKAEQSTWAKMQVEKNRETAEVILRRFRSQAFADWFFSIFQKSPAKFLSEIAISENEYHARYDKYGRTNYTQWLGIQFERVMQASDLQSLSERKGAVSVGDPAYEAARRRGERMKVATPAWASKARILEIYEERDRLNLTTGIRHEVDHELPLQGLNVCGLHCEFNLRVIETRENRKKSNKFDVS